MTKFFPPFHTGCPIFRSRYRISAALLASGTWNFNPAATFACQLLRSAPFPKLAPSYPMPPCDYIPFFRRVGFLAANTCPWPTGNVLHSGFALCPLPLPNRTLFSRITWLPLPLVFRPHRSHSLASGTQNSIWGPTGLPVTSPPWCSALCLAHQSPVCS